MDLSLNSVTTLETAASALTEAVERIEGEANAQQSAAADAPAALHADTATALVQGGFVERILGETRTAVTAPPADPPGVRNDRSVETATLQTFARPHAHGSEAPRHSSADSVLQSGHHANVHAHTDLAVPAALLIPVTLTGLQVEQARSWPLPGRGFDTDPTPLYRARVHDHESAPPPPFNEEPQDEEYETATEQTETKETTDDSCGVVFQSEDGGAWCEELTQALRIALAAKIPPRALLLAAEQWRRGRCVVLACPQHSDPAGPAWAFVLWPRKQAARGPDGAPPPLALYGLRVEARLQWSALPSGVKWCQVRVIKEHHPRSGRQLIAAAPAESSGRVPCEVQLGPVLARPLRCCDVCVRINAARRFWTALGTQWSMQVIVASFPLIGDGAAVEDV